MSGLIIRQYISNIKKYECWSLSTLTRYNQTLVRWKEGGDIGCFRQSSSEKLLFGR